MNDKLMAHLKKKGKKISNPNEKEAKMDVLGELARQAGDMMKEKVGSLKKVTVAAPDSEHLKQGLDKAKEMISHNPDDKMEQAEEELHEDLDHDNEEGESPEHKAKVLGQEESPEHESAESPEMEASEHMSPEQIDEQIKQLIMKKKMLEMKK